MGRRLIDRRDAVHDMFRPQRIEVYLANIFHTYKEKLSLGCNNRYILIKCYNTITPFLARRPF
jgi:hypothetical protein